MQNARWPASNLRQTSMGMVAKGLSPAILALRPRGGKRYCVGLNLAAWEELSLLLKRTADAPDRTEGPTSMAVKKDRRQSGSVKKWQQTNNKHHDLRAHFLPIKCRRRRRRTPESPQKTCEPTDESIKHAHAHTRVTGEPALQNEDDGWRQKTHTYKGTNANENVHNASCNAKKLRRLTKIFKSELCQHNFIHITNSFSAATFTKYLNHRNKFNSRVKRTCLTTV